MDVITRTQKGNAMAKLLLMMLFLAMFSPSAVAQDATAENVELDLLRQLDSRMMMLHTATTATKDLDGDLELVDYQKTELSKLGRDVEEMFLKIKEHEKNGTMHAGVEMCLTMMDSFESRLSSEILLPHQTAALSSMVFNNLLKEKGGDLVSTLDTYYPKQFLFTDAQKKQLDEIKTSTAAEVEKAKREFREKLQNISAGAKKKINTVLTPQQSLALTKLSGDSK
jgi:hypothetical protein